MSSANAEGIFNTSINTVGLLTGPGGGVAIGMTQAGTSLLADTGAPMTDSGVAAGQLSAILTVGEITLPDGTSTTGFQMLAEGFGWGWAFKDD